MGEKDERGKALFANLERGVGIFFKIAIVSFLSARYKSDGLYCRMAGTPSSPTLFFIRKKVEKKVESREVEINIKYNSREESRDSRDVGKGSRARGKKRSGAR